jgi:hypothetical protein
MSKCILFMVLGLVIVTATLTACMPKSDMHRTAQEEQIVPARNAVSGVQVSPAPSASSIKKSLKYLKKDGWLPGDILKKSVLRSQETEVKDHEEIESSTWVPNTRVLIDLKCDPGTPSEHDACSEFPFELTWSFRQIVVFRGANGIFSYRILAEQSHPDGHGNMKLFIFFDSDGDGKFETLDLGGIDGTFEIPQWVKKAKTASD